MPSHKIDHVAITMDGNGRWATHRGLERVEGHKKGAEKAKEIIRGAIDLGISTLTLYCFSTENWKRPQEEVDFIMELIPKHIEEEQEFYNRRGIRIRWIGRRDQLASHVKASMLRVENSTKNNTNLTLFLAVNYGGHDEIIRAFQRIPWYKRLWKRAITEDLIAQHLDTKDRANPDILIRTGGDIRLSNFLLWQSAYSELFFTETLWPDFTIEELTTMVQQMNQRDRRFGGLSQ